MAWTLNVGSRQSELGCDMTGLGLAEFPQIKPIIDVDSYVNPRGDGRRFGQMRRSGQVVSLEISVRPDLRPLDEVWRELLAVWRADEIRSQPGALASLTGESGRKVYGLPVALEPSEQYRLYNLNRATLEFECVDDLWYGPELVTSLTFVPDFTGGLPVPATVPFVLGGGTGVSDYMVTVAGDVDSFPVFELHGPIQDPFIDVVGVGRLEFTGQLAYDQTLQVDTRSWARWVKRNGAAFPGALSPAGARLSDMALSPGSHQVFFGGYDPTGTSSLDVRVEPAFTSF